MTSNAFKRDLIAAMTIACLSQSSGLLAEEKRDSSGEQEKQHASEEASKEERNPGFVTYLLALLEGHLEDSSQPIP